MIPRGMQLFHHDRGFTLIELMTVIGIIAVMSLIVGFQFMGRLPDDRLKSAALDLFSMFQAARVKAVKEGTEYAIVFNTDKGTYDLVSGGSDGKYNGDSLPNDDRVVKQVLLSGYGSGVTYGFGSATGKATAAGGPFTSGDEVSFSNDTAMFNAHGMSGGMGYVYLQNSVDSAYAVAISTMAGVVTMKRWHGADWE